MRANPLAAIAAFWAAQLVAALAASSIATFVLGIYDRADGPAATFTLGASFSVCHSLLTAVVFSFCLELMPPIAAASRRRLVLLATLLGIATLGASALLTSLVTFASGSAVILVIPVGVTVVLSWLTLRPLTERGWLQPFRPQSHCPSCGYDVRLLASPRCPECGEPLGA